MTTDRAKRYAANRTIQDDKKAGCLFCTSKSNLTVDHLDGREENGEPANLAWLCKSCNTRKGAAFRKAGIGRPTNQYNGVFLGLSPEERRNYSQLGFDFPPGTEYYQPPRHAHKPKPKKTRKRKQPETIFARDLRQEREQKKRQADFDRLMSEYAVNPGAPLSSAAQWSEAVRAVLGHPSSMSVPAAASRIRATSPARRRSLSRAMRVNPGKVPTYAQYAWAVATHCPGNKRAFHGDVHGCGAHDEGGAIIHATPPNVRRAYARRMDARRRERERESNEVPF